MLQPAMRTPSGTMIMTAGVPSASVGGGGSSGSLGAQLANCMTEFTTTPEVVVRSKWLRVPELILIVLLFLVGFCYTFLWQLHCLQQIPIQASPLLELRPPMTNFWSCSDLYGTCVAEPMPALNRSLCQGEKEECQAFDAYEALPKFWPLSDTIGVEMARTEYLERRKCYVTGECSDTWERVPGTRTVYTLGFDETLVKIRHHFSAEDWEVTGVDVQSLLQFSNETLPRRTPSTNVGKPIPGEEFFEEHYPSKCGGQSGGRDSCMSTAWGDYINLRTLLAAANMPVSKEMMLQGAVMRLQIEFTNIDPSDFWSWPWGPKPKLIVYPSQVHSSDHDIAEQIIVEYPSLQWRSSHQAPESTSGEAYSSRQGEERLVKHKRMLLIKTASRGKFGRFSYSSFMMHFVVCAAIVLYANKIVNTGLISFYKLFKVLPHVTILHEAETVKMTPPDEEIAKINLQEDGAHDKLHSLIQAHSRQRYAELCSQH